MAITNYPQLISSIALWLNRRDLDAVIPSFIELAETEMNRVLRLPQMVSRRTTNVTEGDNGFVPLPTDFLQPINLEIINSNLPRPLEPLTTQRADTYRARIGGTPAFYSILGQQIELVPHPTGPIDVELSYYARIPPVATNALANGLPHWLLTGNPDLYLYLSLAHSAPFLKNDARLPVWRAFADKAIEDLNRAATASVYGQSPLVMRSKNPIG